jgi:hypothetical protein
MIAPEGRVVWLGTAFFQGPPDFFKSSGVSHFEFPLLAGGDIGGRGKRQALIFCNALNFEVS